jgi:hypothetical protein
VSLNTGIEAGEWHTEKWHSFQGLPLKNYFKGNVILRGKKRDKYSPKKLL